MLSLSGRTTLRRLCILQFELISNHLKDHIHEVLEKLAAGAIDDEIWGKIVVMERCKRVAKAYLRKTTIIVDGGVEEFDGKTIGFNYFVNPLRDTYTQELRAKIGDVSFFMGH